MHRGEPGGTVLFDGQAKRERCIIRPTLAGYSVVCLCTQKIVYTHTYICTY